LAAIVPESNDVPLSEVTVWPTGSLFVQQTVVPGATVSGSGLYAKF
jgi:hypothetical protein